MAFYIRVRNVQLFNAIYAEAPPNMVQTKHTAGTYTLYTDNALLWHELFLYGQILAQDQDAYIDGGEEEPLNLQ